jgi:hypothetical protein
MVTEATGRQNRRGLPLAAQILHPDDRRLRGALAVLAFTAATRSISAHPQWSELLTYPDAVHATTLTELVDLGCMHGLCVGDEPFLQALLNLSGVATEDSFGAYFDRLDAAERDAVISVLGSATPPASVVSVPGSPVGFSLERASVVRARLAAERRHEVGEDPLGRMVTGWRSGLDVAEVWERARGLWRVEPAKVLRARLMVVTSPADVVVAVGTIDTIRLVDERVVVEGRPIGGHPLVGLPDPLATSSFNPIATGTIDVLAPVL